MTIANEQSHSVATCPNCGNVGLHVEHTWSVSVDLDLAGQSGDLGYVCPLLRFSDEGKLDEHGSVEWHTVGRIVDARCEDAELHDGVPVSPEGRAVRAHNAELHDSMIVLSCRCGWSQADHAATPELRSVFAHVRDAASEYRPTHESESAVAF